MKFETSSSSYSVVDIDRGGLEDGSWEPSPLSNGKISKQRDTRDRDVVAPVSYSEQMMYHGANGNSMRTVASGCRHAPILKPQSSSVYLIWPPVRNNGSAEERAAYFSGLQKAADLDRGHSLGRGPQATTLLDIMTIRAFHTKALRRFSLGTALGFRTRGGILTTIPAIIVFVGRKMHKEWLLDVQKLPSTLEGPGGVWCDVDVVEFSYYVATVTPKEQLYTELVEGLRGNDPCIGAGSQVASQESYGTLGGIVRSRTAGQQVGFLTNRHVAVDIDYPNQKMFHPLPPSLGPGVYLGAVERAISFITDDLWYGVFAGINPETFVRADGAFVPFTDTFDLKKITSDLKGVGEMGEVMKVDLQAPIETIIGKRVLKVGRSSGLTHGVIMAYAIEYNDERSICYFTDFLVVGENGQPFDLEGDSGSLILLAAENVREKPRPFGIIWGGTANRGRLKLRSDNGPENWTSGVDLGRLLDLLDLELLTTPASLSAAIDELRSYQLNLERGNSSSGCKYQNIAGCKQCKTEHEENRTVLDDKRPQQKSAPETSGNEGVEELGKIHSNAAPAAGDGPAEEDLLKFAAYQEWRVSSPTPAASEGFDSSLSLGGALLGALPSSGKQEEKRRKEDLKLGYDLGEQDGKRRRFP